MDWSHNSFHESNRSKWLVSCRSTNKGIEFHNFWYATFKMFKGLLKVRKEKISSILKYTISSFPQMKRRNLNYFLIDCLMLRLIDFTIASIFIARFLQLGNGFVIFAVFTLLFIVNLIFFIGTKIVQERMRKERKTEKKLRIILTIW